MKLVCTTLLAAALLSGQSTEADLRKALAASTGTVTLPSGEIEVSREIVMPTDAHDLDIRGKGTTIKASAAFRGRALLVFPAGKKISVQGVSLDGNRDAVARMIGLPPAGTMYSRFLPNNGILAEGVTGLEIAQIMAKHIAGFTVLVNQSHDVRIHDLQSLESGGFTVQHLNNATGGILLEEGTSDFEIRDCFFGKMRGNGISLRSSEKGRVVGNTFEIVARNAIELRQSNSVTIENNHASQIGYPVEEVHLQGPSLPAAISAAGATARSSIRDNQFEQIDGRCMDLGGTAAALVTGNTCSEALFGAIVLNGSGNTISGNHFVRLNLSHRNLAGIMSAGIFLDADAKENTVENNEIGGFGMSKRCVEAVDNDNNLAKNECSDEASVARLLPAIRH